MTNSTLVIVRKTGVVHSEHEENRYFYGEVHMSDQYTKEEIEENVER